MAKQISKAEFKDEEINLDYEVVLRDGWVQFGGQIEITQIKNAGKENETRLPTAKRPTTVQINFTSGTPEELAQALAEHPVLKELIPQIMEKAIKPYKG